MTVSTARGKTLWPQTSLCSRFLHLIHWRPHPLGLNPEAGGTRGSVFLQRLWGVLLLVVCGHPEAAAPFSLHPAHAHMSPDSR